MRNPVYDTPAKREPKIKVLTLSEDETGNTKKVTVFYSIIENNYIEVEDSKKLSSNFKDYQSEIKEQLVAIYGKMKEINFV